MIWSSKILLATGIDVNSNSKCVHGIIQKLYNSGHWVRSIVHPFDSNCLLKLSFVSVKV